MINSANPPAPLVGNWKEENDRLKEKFSKLGSSDLYYEEHPEDERSYKLMVSYWQNRREQFTITGTR